MAFSDFNKNVGLRTQVIYWWFQKPTDTGIILICGVCASLQYKRNIIEGTVCGVFRKNSKWINFGQTGAKLIHETLNRTKIYLKLLARSMKETKILRLRRHNREKING